MTQTSLIAIVEAADTHPPHPASAYPTHSPDRSERYVPLQLTLADYEASLPPVGLLRPLVLAELVADPGMGRGCPWVVRVSDETSEVLCLYFAHWVTSRGIEEMERVMQGTVEGWRRSCKFAKQLKGWRDELCQLYASPNSSIFQHRSLYGPFSNKVFRLERIACCLFGIVQYGVHVIAYEGTGTEMKIWVGRRSSSKHNAPGLMDATVSGGLIAGMEPIDCIIKEIQEEASLVADFVRPRIRSVGTFSLFKIGQNGYLGPGIGYLYDLPLEASPSPEHVEPKPCDDEVESFTSTSIPVILNALHTGKFKKESVSILVDFLIRHGIVTPENEPNYVQIRCRLVRNLGLAVPA